MLKNFANKSIRSWAEFSDFISARTGRWIFRGQEKDWPLQTSLERALGGWGIDQEKAPEIERQMIRDFRRRYFGEHYDRVAEDTLFCLALMQHHGAPTRLLDWTYSPYVAAKFAVRIEAPEPVVWCMDFEWCKSASSKVLGQKPIESRDIDTSRNDSTFLPIYLDGDRRKFVLAENAFHLNPRLVIQQGVFLCPGDVSATLEDNLRALVGWHQGENVTKLCLNLDNRRKREFVGKLLRMNLSSAALFPGLDGFARSLGERLYLYELLADDRTGSVDYVRHTKRKPRVRFQRSIKHR